MADQKPTQPASSFLSSPRFFNGFFSAKTLHDSHSSPTSILDTDKYSLNNPFEISINRFKPKKAYEEINNLAEELDHEGIGLALIEEQNTLSKSNTISRKVLFASKLKIQIPGFSGDYGIKTRGSLFSGTPTTTPTGGVTCPLSLREMELSEEYTRVISHGPNPKTTHIYDNCVVDGVIGSPELKPGPKSKPLCASFLIFCQNCNKNLEEDYEIFIYRGEKAFCSEECRRQEDGHMMNSYCP